jgi:formamidopyrimidine-DNA glycosylase
MPELPEVEIVKRSLNKIANKAKIISVKIRNRNLRYKLPNNFSNKLLNEKITKIIRRSKYIIIYLKKRILLVHLGMTGKFIVINKKNNKVFRTSFYYELNILAQHNHIYFRLNNNFTLIYNDVRRFGFFKIYENQALKNILFLKKLGPEPLSKNFNEVYFKQFIKKRKKGIKNLLMDQKFVSGLGNIYVNEVLHMAKIHPLRDCYNLNHLEIKKIILNVKLILKSSIFKGGSTIKDFKNIAGKSGDFQQFFKVYGRENKNCSRISCKGKIKNLTIGNRSSYYCNNCQI